MACKRDSDPESSPEPADSKPSQEIQQAKPAGGGVLNPDWPSEQKNSWTPPNWSSAKQKDTGQNVKKSTGVDIVSLLANPNAQRVVVPLRPDNSDNFQRGIACFSFFGQMPHFNYIHCKAGRAVCGRLAGEDKNSPLKPYCVVGDDPSVFTGEFTVLPPEEFQPYCQSNTGSTDYELKCLDSTKTEAPPVLESAVKDKAPTPVFKTLSAVECVYSSSRTMITTARCQKGTPFCGRKIGENSLLPYCVDTKGQEIGTVTVKEKEQENRPYCHNDLFKLNCPAPLPSDWTSDSFEAHDAQTAGEAVLLEDRSRMFTSVSEVECYDEAILGWHKYYEPAYCDNGRAVCAKRPSDAEEKPYCLNENKGLMQLWMRPRCLDSWFELRCKKDDTASLTKDENN